MTLGIHEPPVPVALGLGANLGDRLAALQHAIDIVCADRAVVPIGVSAVFETDPVGGPAQPDYLNAVLIISTTLEPVEVLALAALAEADLDRVRDVRWGARTLDVDVISYGDVISEDPLLTLPHPRAAQRAFVLVPLTDVAPDISLAGLSATTEQLLAQCSAEDVAGVRRRSDLRLEIPPVNLGSPS